MSEQGMKMSGILIELLKDPQHAYQLIKEAESTDETELLATLLNVAEVLGTNARADGCFVDQKGETLREVSFLAKDGTKLMPEEIPEKRRQGVTIPVKSIQDPAFEGPQKQTVVLRYRELTQDQYCHLSECQVSELLLFHADGQIEGVRLI